MQRWQYLEDFQVLVIIIIIMYFTLFVIDGSWDWDGYKLVALQIRKDPGITVSAMSAVWHNVWCSVGNYIYVVSGSSLKIEAQFTVHPHKRSIINSMLTVGDGVWVNIKQDSTLRLFHASSFQHLQDLDVGPSINRLLCKSVVKATTLCMRVRVCVTL